jgi:acyl-coenzyme A thioesterase PaaI-like protein
VHGGVSALVLDHILGEAASAGMTKPNFTGTISCRYLRGTPLGALRAEAYIDRVEGVKTFARGFISDADGHTVEAEGVFIRPVWARD